MGQRGEGIDRFTVQQNVEFHEFALAEARRMVVERGIAARHTLQFVIEVYHNLAQWHEELYLHTVAGNEVLLHQFGTFAQTERHDGANVGGCGDDRGTDVRLLHMVDERGVGHAAGVVHLLRLAMFVIDHVTYVRHGCDDVHIKLAVESFLHNLHVEQTQETASETETECSRTLMLESERGIVQLQFLQRGAQVLIVLGLDGVDAGKYHWLHFLKTLDGLVGRPSQRGDGVAHLHFCGLLDARHDVAHIARPQFLFWHHVHLQRTNLLGQILLLRVDKPHLLPGTHHAIDDFEVGNDTSVGVEHRIENQSLQWSLLVAHRVRHTLHHGIQNILHTLARLAAGIDDVLQVASDEVDNLVGHLLGHGVGHVNLVDDRDNLKVMVDGHVEVRNGLRLHTLRGIHHQQCTLAGRNRTAHLIREIHVSGRVNQVQDILLPLELILVAIIRMLHLDGMTLDGDAAFLLQVHVVQHLSLRNLDGVSPFQQSVGQR